MTNQLSASLPLFSAIQPSNIAPQIDSVLQQARATVGTMLANNEQPTWQSLLLPMEAINAEIDAVWAPVSHLNGVMHTDELRAAYNACLPKLSAFGTELGQHPALYRAYKHIANSDLYHDLDVGQRKVISNALRDFRLAGVELPQNQRDEFKRLSQRLSELTARFEQNVLDATHAWKKHITDEAMLHGLPESSKALAAQFAQRQGLTGWLLTLDFPLYMPVMSYADDRNLREQIYTAFVTKASENGPHAGQFDNTMVMADIIKIRHKLANIVGFANHANYSLATKMAESPQAVLDFLTDLATRAKPIADQEYAELQAYAKENGGMDSLAAWDVPYFAEKLRQQRYAVSPEELRPYFPEDKVMSGLFTIVNRLYGLVITERHDVDVWHQDVRFFDIFDEGGELRGQFYLDLYARAGKRGGAWMDGCVGRRRLTNDIVTPVAFLTCNFAEPVGDKPALFTHDEVTTLFHEFGHTLHHILTKIDHAAVAGINGVPWDAVELPSQFMENWAWQREALDMISGHYQTGEALPPALFAKMTAARNFQSAMMLMRQLEFSLFDFRLHLEYTPDHPDQFANILADVRQQVAVVPVPDFNRFAHSFAHIFAGGYAAGYYSYKWAEVLSADAFAKFEETGIFNRDTGNQFLHNILEQGGARDPMDLFIAFRGRKPRIDALLCHSGIAV